MPVEQSELLQEETLPLLADAISDEEPLKPEEFVADLMADTAEPEPEKKAEPEPPRSDLSKEEAAEFRRRLELHERGLVEKTHRDEQEKAQKARQESATEFERRIMAEDETFANSVVERFIPQDGPREVMAEIVKSIRQASRQDAFNMAQAIAENAIQQQVAPILPVIQRLQAGYSAQGFMSRQDLKDLHDLTNEAVYLQQLGVPEEHIVGILRKAKGGQAAQPTGHLRSVERRPSNIQLEESGGGRGSKKPTDADIDKSFNAFWQKRLK